LLGGYAKTPIARQIRDYDPRHEAIFLVLRDDDTITMYRLAGRGLSPLEAYERLRRAPHVTAA
jgi:hypothetical protein